MNNGQTMTGKIIFRCFLIMIMLFFSTAPVLVQAEEQSDIRDLAASLESWRQAWEKGRLEDYLSFYDQSAAQDERQGKEVIRHFKKRLWKTAAPGRVKFDDFQFYRDARGFFVLFAQQYQAKNGFFDQGYKTIIAVKEGSQWRIIEERWYKSKPAIPYAKLERETKTVAPDDPKNGPLPKADLPEEDDEDEGDEDEALDQETDSSFDYNNRQMDAIEARITNRMGYYEKALQLYAGLRIKYPTDIEIWEDYIETLVDNWDYEKAFLELATIRRRQTLSPRAARLAARIYVETNHFERSLHVIEDVLSDYRRNAGVMADSAYIRTNIGDKTGALYYYSGVLEMDPENESVRDALHDLLRETRPRIDAGYRMEFQANGALVRKASTASAMPVNSRVDVAIQVNRVDITRPLGTFSYEINSDLSEVYLQLGWRMKDRWRAYLNAGGYSGLGGGFSPSAGLAYDIYRSFKFRLDYEHHRPWYDPVEAAFFGGYQNRASTSVEWIYHDQWIVSATLKNTEYYTGDWGYMNGYFGRQAAGSIGLTRKLTIKPELFVGYNYYKSAFTPFANGYDYGGTSVTPIPMLDAESIHTFLAGVNIRFNQYLNAYLNGGYRVDTARSISSWYVMPSLQFRFRNRLEAECGYEYTSEAETAAGGQASAVTMKVRWIW